MTDSSQSPHNLYLLFYGTLSILAFIWLVLIALICAAIGIDSVSLLRFPFLSHVLVFLCEKLLIRCLKRSKELFFFPFFPGYCRSVGPYVVSIVSRAYHQFSSALLYVIFKSLHWCVITVFNVGKFSSSFFSWRIDSVNVISEMYCFMHGHQFSCSLVPFFKFFSDPLQEWSQISGIYSFDKVSCCIILSRVAFLVQPTGAVEYTDCFSKEE